MNNVRLNVTVSNYTNYFDPYILVTFKVRKINSVNRVLI